MCAAILLTAVLTIITSDETDLESLIFGRFSRKHIDIHFGAALNALLAAAEQWIGIQRDKTYFHQATLSNTNSLQPVNPAVLIIFLVLKPLASKYPRTSSIEAYW